MEQWYLPSRINDYNHFARVVIASEDDATIFVNFILPKDPEFIVFNKTDELVKIR